MWLGAVGSAETSDMLCGLSRDSPAEAGRWSMQTPHQLSTAEGSQDGGNGTVTLGDRDVGSWLGKRACDP